MKNNERAGKENKPHIGIFGRCNSGKSSLLNFIVDADTAIVSPESGTTTDVVRKSYEILDFAPVIFIDTAGIDDLSPLGAKRISRTLDTIAQIDLALLVFREWGEAENDLMNKFERANVPFILVRNIVAIDEPGAFTPICEPGATALFVKSEIRINALSNDGVQRNALLDAIKLKLPETSYTLPSMFGGRVRQGDIVLLVTPIDSEAPAGRMILPQVQAIRELLELNAIPIVVQPPEISAVLGCGITPVIVVTDSQVFPEVRNVVPAEIEVTSFSILLAASKGDYGLYLKGLEKVDELKTGDRILITESCTHQVSCEDIGRVKIPRWMEDYIGHKFDYTIISGLSPLPDDLASYSLMIQCGGCMVTRSQLRNRLRQAEEAGVPVTNYGMLIRKIRK